MRCPTMLLLATLAFSAASAAELQVAPTRLQFGPDDRVQTLQLSNLGDSEVLVEVQVFAWQGDAQGSRLEPTDDILVSPPITPLRPGSSVPIRVGFTRTTGDRCESAYRIWVTEVPVASAGRPPVRLRSRISLPIFRQHTPDCAEQLDWDIDAAQGVLTIHNTGGAHAQLRDVIVQHDRQQTSLTLPELGYILPGAALDVPLPESVAALASAATLQLRSQVRHYTGPLADRD